MANNQELNQEQDIAEFKKSFFTKHGIKLYVYTPSRERKENSNRCIS